MDWSLKKRLLYAGLLSEWLADQQQATPDAATGAGDVGDLDQLAAEATQHQQAAGAQAGGGAAPTPGHLPNDLDPADVPTPDGVENPYTSGQGGAGSETAGAAVDGDRVTRRADAEPDAGGGEDRQLYDPREIHPAVRKHGSVVRVRNDDDDGHDDDETTDA